MPTRRIGISEARRLLPELVKSIAKEGGRVDITYRGEPRVSLLRVSDVKGSHAMPAPQRALPPALRVELSASVDLLDTIREFRGRQGQPRAGWLKAGTRPPKTRKPSSRRVRPA